jgi:ketosteroid isomerase-like protein
VFSALLILSRKSAETGSPNMRIESLIPAPFLIAACLIGCAQAPAHDVEADDEAIRAMYEQRLEQIQGGSDLESIVAAYMSVLAEDAVMMPPNAPPVEGTEAVENWVREFFATYELDVHDWPMDVLEIGPQLAVRRFRSVGLYIPKEGGEPVPYDQKYVDHLRKRADGRWEIVLHMWSPNDTGPNIWH